MLDVIRKHFLERERPRHAVNYGEMDSAEGYLHLRILEKVIQHHIRRSVALYVDRDSHTLAVGMVVAVADAFELLFLDKVADALNQPGFVDLIGQLCDNDLIASVRSFHNFRLGADGYLAAACCIGGADAGTPHDDAACREIGALDTFHQLVERRVRISEQQTNRVDCLSQIVRRDIGRHADRYAGGAVDKQVGIT